MTSSKTKYLSIAQILAIHDHMIDQLGGSHGMRDLNLLESAVTRPQSSYGGRDLYETIFDKAAALLHSLLKNHAFIDGNKRTAYAATGLFLEINGYALRNTHDQAVQFTVSIDTHNLGLEKISKWLEENTTVSEKSE